MRRAHYAANKERLKADAQRRYRERRETRRAQQAAYYQTNWERERERQAEYRKTLDRTKYAAADRDLHLRRKYGITHSDYELMLEGQGGRCAGCGTTNPMSRGGVFHVDHDHETGVIRGLLCKPCNTALGNLSDSVETLMSLAAYLLQSTSVLSTLEG